MPGRTGAPGGPPTVLGPGTTARASIRVGFAGWRQSPGTPQPYRQTSGRNLFPPKRSTGIPPDRPASSWASETELKRIRDSGSRRCALQRGGPFAKARAQATGGGHLQPGPLGPGSTQFGAIRQFFRRAHEAAIRAPTIWLALSASRPRSGVLPWTEAPECLALFLAGSVRLETRTTPPGAGVPGVRAAQP